MAIAPVKIFHDTMPNPESTVYTVPGGLTVVLRRILVVNVSAGPAAGSVSVAGKRVLNAKSISNGDVFPLDVGALRMAAGDTLSALSSVGGALVLVATGFSL